MLQCKTLLCVKNQMPDVGGDDLFFIGFLVMAVVITMYLILEAWRGD